MRAALGNAAVGIVALALLLPGSGANPAQIPGRMPEAATTTAGSGLSPRGVAELKTILGAARLAELRWPDFSNYKKCVAEIYATTDDRFLWIDRSRPTPQALSMIRVLENAGAEGLEAADYDGGRWGERLAEFDGGEPPRESGMVRFDVALTVSAMRYISDLHLGRVDPRLYHRGFDVEQKQYDLARFLLERMARSENIERALDEIEPPFPAYHRTLRALAEYRKLAREYEGEAFAAPEKTVDAGEPFSAAPRLAQLLRLLGDMPAGTQTPPGNIYGGALVDAVKRFQVRHGLEPDGRIGRQTLAALNVPLRERVRQLELTLERWRWLPHQFARPPIIVNIPEFRLHAMNGEHRQALTMKVVVGKAYGHQTPVLAAEIRSVVFRPYWEVPYSIQRNELVPNVRKNPEYLLKNDYEVVDAGRRLVSEGEADARIVAGLREGTLYARQRPGRKNSLGLIKFDMPNPYDIYMHGTPATSLFSRSRRDFSHGCIRVEDPVALAKWVLRERPGWTAARIRAAMHGKKTFREGVAKPVPVLIVYGTAVVDENGRTYFFRDVYGLDAVLEKALAGGRPYPDAASVASKDSPRSFTSVPSGARGQHRRE